MPELDLDLLRSASHQSMAGHLTGLFAGGMRERPLPLDAAGKAVVDVGSRQPLLLLAPRADVGATGYSMTVKVSVGTTVRAQVTLRFEPYSEAGAFLPAFHPDPLGSEAAAMPALAVEVTKGAGAPDVPVAQLVEARLVEGVMGRLLYAMGAEKQRLRRQARELFAMRQLEHAARNALDRVGLELGIPRLEDRLTWDAAKQQPGSVTEREGDASYRRRLALHRSFVMATPRQVLERLNGPAGDTATNTGPLAALGVTKRFTLFEANTEFAVGIRLLGPHKVQFLAHIKNTYLLTPGTATPAVPANRLLTQLERTRQEDMLTRLRTNYQFVTPSFFAPGLADALDLVGRCRVALGVVRKWVVFRGQQDAGGSRYELGLGVEVEAPPAAELTTMVANLRAGTFAAGTDVQLIGLLKSLTPVAAAEDPAGRWLLAGCGLRTVHRTPGVRYFLSHVPMHGQVVSDEPGPASSLGARLQAPEDNGLDAVLHHALADVETDAGGVATVWTRQTAAAAPALWDQAATMVPLTALTALTAAGLRPARTLPDLERTLAGLKKVPPELMVTLSLVPTLANGLLANDTAALGRLTALVGFMKQREVVSVLPLVTSANGVPNGVLLVVSAIPLPARAAVLNPRREDFRWYVLPLSGTKSGTLEKEAGSRNRYVAPATGAGLDAVVTVTLTRRNRADPRGRVRPFEAKVVMDSGARLNITQYEYLMNLLERLTPLGVVLDTRTLREEQVDPGAQGTAVPMTGLLARSFRAFRQGYHPGERYTPTVK